VVKIQEHKPIKGSMSEGNATILLVDDEEAVVAVIKRILEQSGYKVMTAGDGLEAIELYKQHSDIIKLVLLDLIMPKMDGDEAFLELMRLNPDIQVVISSGYSQDIVSERFSTKAPAGFVQKPYRAAELLGIVREVLQPPLPP
jgi:CheY-like chemotaxis protein